MSASNTVYDELLIYAVHYINKSNLQELEKVIVNFYSNDAVSNAKRTLWGMFGSVIGSSDSGDSSRKHQNVSDILQALCIIDSCNLLPKPVVNLDNFPSQSPDQFSIKNIMQRIEALEKALEKQRVTALEEAMKKVTLSDAVKEELNEIQKQETGESKGNRDSEAGIQKEEPVREGKNTFFPDLPQDIVIMQGEKKKKQTTCSKTNDRYLLSSCRSDVPESVIPCKVFTNHDEPPSQVLSNDSSVWDVMSSSSSNTEDTSGVSLDCTESDQRSLRTVSLSSASFSSTPSSSCKSLHRESADNKRERRLRRTKESWSVVSKKEKNVKVKSVFVYNLDCNDITLRKYMERNGVRVISLEEKSKPNAITLSFKVTIEKQDLYLVLSEKFWPRGIFCKEWVENYKGNRRETNGNKGNSLNNNTDEDKSSSRPLTPARIVSKYDRVAESWK